MRNVKHTLFNFCTGDFKGVERYLNEQAARGWKLDRVGLLLGRFVRAERDDLRWCVDLVDGKRQREDTEEYLGLCAEGGWDLVSQTSGMYLFCSRPGLRPTPIQTDPELEKKNYNKYYIKSTILSVLIVAAWIAFYALMIWAMGGSRGNGLERFWLSMRYSLYEKWITASLLFLLPVWGLTALWKLIDFFAALVRNRNGLCLPRLWIMWANAIAQAASLIGGVLLVLCAVLDALLTPTSAPVSLLIVLAGWGLYAIYRGFTLERDIFPRERKNSMKLGIICLAAAVLVGVGTAITPFGEWSSYRKGETQAETEYAALADKPVVRAEDLGTAEDRVFYWVLHALTPAGERWQVDNYIGKYFVGCETYRCPFTGMARALARSKVEEVTTANHSLSSFRDGICVTAMEPLDLDWADEAWYGEDDDGCSALVVRVGRNVTCLTSQKKLRTEELLTVIEGRLAG